MKMLSIILALLLIFSVKAVIPHFTEDQIKEKIGGTSLTYGSTIRIKDNLFTFHLHSHLVNYPRGSGHQSVTGMADSHDYNSLWTIKEAHQEKIKTYDQTVKCGDSVRLQHALTKGNLHSEEIFQSMITQNQEVSVFGKDGNGDQNDNWIIKCKDKQEGQVFYAGDIFQIIHQNTEKYLKMSRYYSYGFQNWQGCPFQGQLQVSAVSTPTKQTYFKIVGGIFFHDIQEKEKEQEKEQEDNSDDKDSDL